VLRVIVYIAKEDSERWMAKFSMKRKRNEMSMIHTILPVAPFLFYFHVGLYCHFWKEGLPGVHLVLRLFVEWRLDSEFAVVERIDGKGKIRHGCL